MALNILSTGVMVKLGKVYGNRMVDVSVTNSKLRDRAVRMVRDLANLNRTEAEDLLDRSGNRVKTALLMHWAEVDRPQAEQLLTQGGGQLRQALTLAQSASSPA
jgi:N-acetylmuramic acid 6-phosphate etherase